MKYTVDFSPHTFEWYGSAKRVVGYVAKAGKMDEFGRMLSYHFGYSNIPSAEEINKYVNDHQVSMLHDLGMGPDGKPLKNSKIKVFLRLEAMVEQEVEADTPEKAREKAAECYLEDSDPLLSILRDDVQSLTPVAYDMGDGDTKDYEEEE
jgi:hypothetical protein